MCPPARTRSLKLLGRQGWRPDVPDVDEGALLRDVPDVDEGALLRDVHLHVHLHLHFGANDVCL